MNKRFAILLLVFGMAGCTSRDADVWRADRLARSADKASKEAVRLYEEALRLSPPSGAEDIRLKLARRHEQAGDYERAAEVLKSVSSLEARRLLARVLLKSGDYSGALDIFNRIGDQGDDAFLFDYATAAEKSNLHDLALRLYGLIAVDPVLVPKARERIRSISLESAQSRFAGVDEDVRKRVETSPTQKEYPDASGIYLLLDEDIRLTEDNRSISEAHYVIKILNDRGKEKFGEISLGYDATYEKLELEYARTIKPDGTVVTVGDKNIRDVSVYLNFPLYSNARARIISMPEVAPGAVIEYKVKITCSQLPNKKDFNTAYWLAIDEPILMQKCRIIVPKGKDLKYKIINGEYNTLGFDLVPKLREEKLEKIYTLELSNIPQIMPEAGMPPLSRINPYILFSTFSSWQDIYQWWKGLYKDKVVPDEDIKAKARALVKDKKSEADKIRAIYNFCAQEIRYVAVEYGDAGYEPHKALEIFRNKYGDCKDKAILLISMLSAVGIDAYPVLISTSDSLDVQEDMPSLVFDHAIAAVRMEGQKTVFLDATGTTVPFGDLPIGDQDRLVLVFFKDKYTLMRTPLFEPEHNRMSTLMKIKILPDESIEARREVSTHGLYEQAQRFWLKFTMPTVIEEDLKTKARLIAPGAVLKAHEIRNVGDSDQPIFLAYSFSAPQYLKKAGRTRILDQFGGLDTSVIFKESRAYPIELMVQEVQEETIEVELPAHLAVKYLPKPVLLETKWFEFINRYDRPGKNTLRFYSFSKTKQRTISVTEYPAYKKALEEAAASSNQQVIIEER